MRLCEYNWRDSVIAIAVSVELGTRKNTENFSNTGNPLFFHAIYTAREIQKQEEGRKKNKIIKTKTKRTIRDVSAIE